jgi:hypothetical protein
LDKLEARSALSDEGRCWLTKALDPFHDFEVRCSGLPDGDTSATVVEEFKETVTVSAPLGTVGNWDAHVFSLPFATTEATPFQLGSEYSAGCAVGFNVSTTGIAGPFYGSDGADTYIPTSNSGVIPPAVQLGLINVHAFNETGGNMVPSRSAASVQPASVTVLGSAGAPGRRRLIACGLEIHDTTSMLNKQGTLTAYRMPQAPSITTARGGKANYQGPGTATPYVPIFQQYSTGPLPTSTFNNAAPGLVPYEEYNLPPANPALAMEYAGSRQWEAKDGVYMVLAQDSERNNLSFSNNRHLALTDGDFTPSQLLTSNAENTGTEAWYTNSFYPLFFGNGSGATANWNPAANGGYNHLSVPFHTGGVMLTGLNPLSTFTVTVRSVWEIAPVTGDSVVPGVLINPLVPLAAPSPEFDPIALELYQRAVTQLPVAVPVGMNAAGDFWDWVLGAVKTVAPMVGMALGGPAGGAVGGMVAKGLGGMQQRRNLRAARKDSELPVADNAVFKAAATPFTFGKKAKAQATEASYGPGNASGSKKFSSVIKELQRKAAAGARLTKAEKHLINSMS